MEKENQVIKDHKERYRNENSEDRVSRWVLGTIKWQYDFGYIIGSGGLDENRAYGEKFKNLSKKEQEYLIETCSNAYKPFKKYLLINICYLFGAYYEQCIRKKIKFEPTRNFLVRQFNSYYSMIEKFYKKPNKEENIWMTMFDNLFEKKDLNINKNFFLALYPPLKKQDIDSIIRWFLGNWKKNDSVKAVFDTARNYFHLEDDKNSPFRKITEKNDFQGSMEFACDADTDLFKNSILSSRLPLRFTYYTLAKTFLEEINNSYLFNETKDKTWNTEKFVSKIIQNGPDLKLQENQFSETTKN